MQQPRLRKSVEVMMIQVMALRTALRTREKMMMIVTVVTLMDSSLSRPREQLLKRD